MEYFESYVLEMKESLEEVAALMFPRLRGDAMKKVAKSRKSRMKTEERFAKIYRAHRTA